MSVHALAASTASTMAVANLGTHSSSSLPSLLPNPPSPTGNERSLVGRVSESQEGSAQGPSAVFNQQVVPPRDLLALREECRKKRVVREAENAEMPNLVQLRAERTAELAQIDGKFGIKLDESVLGTWGRNKELPPVTVEDYWDAIYDQRENPNVPNLMTQLENEKAPIKVTLREAFEYVMQKVENYSTIGVLYVTNDVFMMELRNIKFEDINAVNNFPGMMMPINTDYRSWLHVICHMLKDMGKVGDYALYSKCPCITPWPSLAAKVIF